MDGAVSGRSALRLIEERFHFLISEHGFELTQSADVPAMAWYSAPGRAVVVSYDVSFDAPFSVALEEGGSRYDLWQLAAMRDHANPPAPSGPQTAQGLGEACRRARELLDRYCLEFVRGDPQAFRRASRESVLVESCRELARSAYFEGDYKLALRLYEALRDYWDERDRETFELAKRGETPLTKVKR